MKRSMFSRPSRVGRTAHHSSASEQPRRNVCGICGGTLPRHARRCPYASNRVAEEMQADE